MKISNATQVKFNAPAKINLHLRVAPVGADGFHPLLTWMATIGLFDTITLKRGSSTGEILMSCSDPSLPCDDRNLVVKAAKLLRENAGDSIAIHLEKRIPHGGGLGGGSSDAAFTAMALNRFWALHKDAASLNALASKLGSDVPFFLHGPSSVCRGRGEEVRPIGPPLVARWVLLILPAISMPTPAVYKQFDAMKLGNRSMFDNEPDWGQWKTLPSLDLLPRLANDLELPAFSMEPRLATLRREIEQIAGRPVRMSGSGSSLFTLFDQRNEAENLAGIVSQLFKVKSLAVELARPPKPPPLNFPRLPHF